MSKAAAFLVLAAIALPAHPVRAADEIHWTFTGPTSVAIDWRGSESTVRYGLTSSYGSTVTAQTPSPVPFSSSGPFWEARVTGLAAGTTYHYSVGTGPDHVFRTPPTAPGSFVVYAYADIGDSASYPRVVPVAKLIGAAKPAFVLPIGDLTIANDHGQSHCDNAFNNMMYWSLDAAAVPTWGNHDWDTPTTDDLRNYKGRFAFPNSQASAGAPSVGGTGEDWFWFDYGNVRFIAYPEPYASSTWPDWNAKAKVLMDSAQANPAIRFIVTFGHRPAYSSGHHAGDGTLKSYLDALGSGHSKYVLNLNGHSHNYERTYPQHGVTHITAGGGGATLEEESGTCKYAGGCPAPSWSAFRAYYHGPVRLTFTPGSITADFICGPAGDTGANLNDISCTSGTVVDSYVIGSSTAGVEPPGPVTSLGFALREIRPNPTMELPSIAYTLPTSDPASLQLVDVAGRVILRQDLGAPGAGPHETRLSGTAPAPGVYWIRLTQAERHVSSTVIFTR